MRVRRFPGQSRVPSLGVPAVLLMLLLLPMAVLAASPARVLVYGDSNSWGWKATAQGFPTQRHDPADRWPEVMRDALGTRAEVVVDALSGRTVDVDHVSAVGELRADAFNGLQGIAAAVARELPLDWVVVMLGTNDMARDQHRNTGQVAAGMAQLVRQVRGIAGGVSTTYPAPCVLVVAPAPLGDVSRTPIGERFDAASVRSSRALAAAYRQALDGVECVSVMDAGEVIGAADGQDGIHLTATQQRALGAAVAGRLAAQLNSSHPQEVP